MNGGDGLCDRRLRAPVDDGSTLISPPLEQISEVIASNQKLLGSETARIGSSYLTGLRQEARHIALDRALRYTRSYADVSHDLDDTEPWILSGHQPQLFHPGVWFKNFVLDSIRKSHNSVAIHVLIDNDLCRSNSIRVPMGEVSSPAAANVEFDGKYHAIPFEERDLRDREIFDRFGKEVTNKIRDLVPNPIIAETWKTRQLPGHNLGQLLSSYRHRLELQWGSNTLEVPLSSLCESRPFRILVAHMVLHRRKLWTIYNRLLREYRKINHIRSDAHPVPDLKMDGEWFELPFWVWEADQPTRKPLYASSTQRRIILSDRNREWQIEGSDEHTIGDRLSEISATGFKIRPRAISNTIFLRLILADLFLHGIGGAKYDELTDAIIQEFFGFSSPKFLTLSATLRLPISNFKAPSQKPSELSQLLRQSHFHPEKFLSDDQKRIDQVSNWIAQKRRLVALELPKGTRRKRHHSIREINSHLQPLIKEKQKTLKTRFQQSLESNRITSLLRSREYSFCLFPESTLRTIIWRD